MRWAALALLALQAGHCFGLEILLTNDDGWKSHNLRALKQALVEAGHQVIVSAPCLDQSGMSGAMTVMRHIPVDRSRTAEGEYCVGDTDLTKAHGDFAEGTPVVAALFALDVLMAELGRKPPDLVISGPNFGNNLGVMNNHSGTMGAALVALERGVPTMSVSTDMSSKYKPEQAPVIAGIVRQIVGQLEQARQPAEPLLPRLTGLNVNIPPEPASHKGFRLTRQNWNSGVLVGMTRDLAQNDRMMTSAALTIMQAGGAKDLQAALALARIKFASAMGLVFNDGNLGDLDPESEGTALKQGFVTISVIDGNLQAPDAVASAVNQRLKGLAEGGSQSPPEGPAEGSDKPAP